MAEDKELEAAPEVETAPEPPLTKSKTKAKPKPKAEPESNAKILDTGKNGKYEVLLVSTKEEKSVVLVEKVLKRPGAGYTCFKVGERLTVHSDMVS